MTRLDSRSARRQLSVLLAAAAVLFAACGGPATYGSPALVPTVAPTAAPVASTAPAASSAAYRVEVAQNATLGSYLTGEDGRSLYLLTKDAENATTCTAACAAAWPPFELDPGESIAAGDGVSGTLATITRADDGKMQVTYNGIPLYYFASDTTAGDINGQGRNGVWFLVGPTSTAQGGQITGGVGQGQASVPAPATAAPSAASVGGGRYGSASASPTSASASPTSVATATTAASVEIANFAFAPGNLSIKAGTAVTWTNGDAVAHTVTATDGTFGSGQLGPATTFSHTFASAGIFTYHCTIHSAMTATITVTL